MSDYRIEVNYLKKEELQYELQLRGVVTTEKTVDEMRPQLRSLLSFEVADKSLHYPKYSFNIDNELTVIQDKVIELSELVNSFVGSAEDNQFKRIRTRLIHTLKRTDRIPVANLPADKCTIRSSSFSSILQLMDQIEAKSKVRQSILETSILPNANTSDDFIESSDSDTETRPPAVPRKSRSTPVMKWNLKFTGDPKGMSVHTFLERVTELRIARNVSETELFGQALDLFEGRALLWYRANRNRTNNWKGLATLLTRHYEPPDYRARLLQEIMSRTQDSSESIVDYLACMTAMFERYGNVSEELRLDIICKNLSPFYIMQLPAVKTLSELEEECLKLEIKKFRAEHHVAPTLKRSAHVEPDFAFVKSQSEPLATDEAYAIRPGPSRPMTCWNCQKTGHLRQDCTAAQKRFCYRCGQPDVTVRTCPTCSFSSTSGNANRRP